MDACGFSVLLPRLAVGILPPPHGTSEVVAPGMGQMGTREQNSSEKKLKSCNTQCCLFPAKHKMREEWENGALKMGSKRFVA